jgi:hypothetical protein
MSQTKTRLDLIIFTDNFRKSMAEINENQSNQWGQIKSMGSDSNTATANPVSYLISMYYLLSHPKNRSRRYT